jgi:hypothetical protein
MDATTGKLLNAFESHLNTSYRCRACFGFNEATVVCGDENGMIWAWDLLDVSLLVLAVMCIGADDMGNQGDCVTAKPSSQGSQ